NVNAAAQGFFDPVAGSAVKVVENPGMFEKGVLFQHGFESGNIDKMVVNPVSFARPFRPGGVGYGDLNACEIGDKTVDQAGFACARWGRNGKKSAFGGHARCIPLLILPPFMRYWRDRCISGLI